MVAVLAVVVCHQPTPPFRTVESRREPNQLHALSGRRFAKGLVPHTDDDVHHHLDPDRSLCGTPTPGRWSPQGRLRCRRLPRRRTTFTGRGPGTTPRARGRLFRVWTVQSQWSVVRRWSVRRSPLLPVVGMI